MNEFFRSWPAGIAAATLTLLAGTGTATASQRTAPEPVAAHQGLVQDWSTRTHVYSNPDTPEDATRKGTLTKWHRDYQDPRFVLSLLRKLDAQADAAGANSKTANKLPLPGHNPKPPVAETMHRDWSQVLGGATTTAPAGRGLSGVYPAKYSFDINAAPDCTNDFVVFPTAASGALEVVVGAYERNVATFSAATPVGTITIGTANTARSVVITAGASNNGQTFAASATASTSATNLATVVNWWASKTGITASVAGAAVTLSQNTHGNLAAVAVTESMTNLALGGNQNGGGAPGQPTIVAFNKLYSSCTPAPPAGAPYTPSVLFAHYTNTSRIVETSPVLSYFDGAKQVAFVQRNTATTPDTLELVLLKWASGAGAVGSPTLPTAVATGAYRACTAPCMTVMLLNGTTTVNAATVSSPYVDYFGDIIWVGDGNGRLHKVTGVFGGTPTEVTTGGFPATVSTGNNLSPPVYDGNTGMVFVGSDASATTGGILHKVDASTGAVTNSARLSAFNTTGVVASPVLDSSAARVYAVVFDDDSDNDAVPPANCNGGNVPPCKALYQFVTSFAANNKGTRAQIGHGNTGSATRAQYGGTFDDAYYVNATPTGNIYICGSDNDTTSIASLWKIPITNNVMGTPVQGATLTNNGTVGNCSPVAEVKNGSHEYLYVSIQDNANQALCSADCLFMFDLTDLNGSAAGTGAAWGPTNVPTAALRAYGGTGGIIVDNISATAGASQVYFSNIGTAAAPYGNATQASQAGLQ